MMTTTQKRKIEPLIYWVSVIGGMFVLFVIDGYLRTYGLLYLELLDKYNQGPQKTGLVATIFAIFTCATAPLVGLLIDLFGAWIVLLVAGLVGAFGAMMAAFAPTIILVYIGYGIFVSWAGTTAFVATTSAIAQCFLYNRTLALGIVFAGGSLGTIIYPLLFRALTSLYSLRGVLIFLAGFFLNYIVVAFVFRAGRKVKLIRDIHDKNDNLTNNNVQKQNETNSQPPPIQHEPAIKIDIADNHTELAINFIKAFLTLKFLSACLWYFTYVYAIFGYLMYFPPYARELGMTDSQIAALISIFGATDLVSRISVGFLGGLSWVSIYVLTSINMIIVGIMTILLPTLMVHGSVYPILIGHMVVMGLFGGGIYGLLGTIVVDAVGTEKSGTGIGVAAVCFGIAIGLPPNIYGALKESTTSYIWVPYLSGASFLLCSVVVQIGQMKHYLNRLSCHKKTISISQ